MTLHRRPRPSDRPAPRHARPHTAFPEGLGGPSSALLLRVSLRGPRARQGHNSLFQNRSSQSPPSEQSEDPNPGKSLATPSSSCARLGAGPGWSEPGQLSLSVPLGSQGSSSRRPETEPTRNLAGHRGTATLRPGRPAAQAGMPGLE